MNLDGQERNEMIMDEDKRTEIANMSDEELENPSQKEPENTEADSAESENTPESSNDGEGKTSDTSDQSQGKTEDTQTENTPDNNIDALQKRVKDQETFINQRNNEVGQLRKQINQLSQIINKQNPKFNIQEMNQKFFENPVEAFQEYQKILKTQELESQQQIQAKYENNEKIIKNAIPEFNPEDLKMVLEADGFKDMSLSNPYTEDPIAIIQMSKRAALMKENATLKAENEQLKKRPGQIIDQINKNTQSTPKITGGAGATSEETKTKLSRAEIANLPDSDL